MFFFKDGRLNLKENISLDEIDNYKFTIDCYSDRDDKLICGELLGFHDSPECLDILDAKKIIKSASLIVDDEKKIEIYLEDKNDIDIINVVKYIEHIIL